MSEEGSDRTLTPEEVAANHPHFTIDSYDPIISGYVAAALLCERADFIDGDNGITLVGARSSWELVGELPDEDELLWFFVSINGIKGQASTNEFQIGIIHIDSDSGEPLDSDVIAYTRVGPDGGGIEIALPIAATQIPEYGTYHLSVFIDGAEMGRATLTRVPASDEDQAPPA